MVGASQIREASPEADSALTMSVSTILRRAADPIAASGYRDPRTHGVVDSIYSMASSFMGHSAAARSQYRPDASAIHGALSNLHTSRMNNSTARQRGLGNSAVESSLMRDFNMDFPMGMSGSVQPAVWRNSRGAPPPPRSPMLLPTSATAGPGMLTVPPMNPSSKTTDSSYSAESPLIDMVPWGRQANAGSFPGFRQHRVLTAVEEKDELLGESRSGSRSGTGPVVSSLEMESPAARRPTSTSPEEDTLGFAVDAHISGPRRAEEGPGSSETASEIK